MSESFFMSAGITKITTMNDFPGHSGIYCLHFISHSTNHSLPLLSALTQKQPLPDAEAPESESESETEHKDEDLIPM